METPAGGLSKASRHDIPRIVNDGEGAVVNAGKVGSRTNREATNSVAAKDNRIFA
jgi:hypothetical protein